MAPVIGDLFQKLSGDEWEWRIPGFLSLLEEIDECYCSGDFYFSGACWYLTVFPNGESEDESEESEDESEGWVGLYLTRRDSGPPLTVRYTLGVRKADGTKEDFENNSHTFPPPRYTGWGTSQFLLRTDLDQREAELAPSELLTVIVTLKKVPRRSIEGEKDIGRVVQTGRDTFHWEIPEFSEQEDVYKFSSPEIHLSESTWMLTMYPKGTGDFSEVRMLLALRRCRSQLANSRKPFHCTAGIKDADGEETPLGTHTHDLSVGGYILYPSSVSLDKDSKIDYVPSDTVTITLRIRDQEETVSQGGAVISRETQVEDLCNDPSEEDNPSPEATGGAVISGETQVEDNEMNDDPSEEDTSSLESTGRMATSQATKSDVLENTTEDGDKNKLDDCTSSESKTVCCIS